MNTHGAHFVADLWGCDAKPMHSAELLGDVLDAAARAAGVRCIDQIWTYFPDFGVSGRVVTENGYISVQTWPDDSGLVNVDVFLCDADAGAAFEAIRKALRPVTAHVVKLTRGDPDGIVLGGKL